MEPQITTIRRITKKELREVLQRGEGVVIVDAREPKAFEASNVKPKASVRIAPGTANGETARLQKSQQIVTV
ncbi:MAG: hypothetical protein HY675_20285 [Chloroflexi bacterium]|nr:hypothetical protein [Chloroflexota bacterium]